MEVVLIVIVVVILIAIVAVMGLEDYRESRYEEYWKDEYGKYAMAERRAKSGRDYCAINLLTLWH